MSNTVFQTSTQFRFAAQPSSATRVYVRSDNNSDSTASDIYGTVSGVPSTEFLQIDGNYEVLSADSYTALSQYVLDAACAGTVSGFSEGTAAVGDVRVDTNPTDGDTITIPPVTYRFKNTMAQVNDVKIGATISDTAANLKAAINADGTPGVEYYAGTALNAGFSATVATGVVTITDRIPCNRLVPISFTESASNFSIRQPIGGVDGTLLFSVSPGNLAAADQLVFSSEDHVSTTLPALMLATSTNVNVAGNNAMLRVWGDQSIKFKVQSSTDQTNWHDTTEGEQTLVASTMTYLELAELHEFIRLVITENLNTTDTVLDARVIY